jgi:hypothetical protein
MPHHANADSLRRMASAVIRRSFISMHWPLLGFPLLISKKCSSPTCARMYRSMRVEALTLSPKVPEELLAFVQRIRLRFSTLELADALSDELAREDGDRTRQIERLLHFCVNLFGDDGSDVLVQIPEASREAPFAEERDAGYEGVMEWGQQPSRRDSLARDLLEFACGDRVSDPPFHEARQKGFDTAPRLVVHGYAVAQTSTFSKNSPARRPVRRLTWRVSFSSRRRPDCSRISGYNSFESFTTMITGAPVGSCR